MNLDVDMSDVAAELADQVRDLLVENLILKKAVEKMADRLNEVDSREARKSVHHAEWGHDPAFESL